MTEPTTPKVFISYSRKDAAWKDRVLEHLRVLENAGELTVWDDQRINAGDDWRAEIETAMQSAAVALLLVSTDFLNSAFIRRTEIPRLLAQRQDQGLRIIPVFARACAWKAVPWLAALQGRPRNGKALAELRRHQVDSHLAELALEVGDLLGQTGKQVAIQPRLSQPMRTVAARSVKKPGPKRTVAASAVKKPEPKRTVAASAVKKKPEPKRTVAASAVKKKPEPKRTVAASAVKKASKISERSGGS